MQWPPTSPGVKGRKFHLVRGRLEHVRGRDAEPVENHRQLVHQRDVEIALRVLDDLRGLGDLDAGRAMDAGCDDRPIDRGDALERLAAPRPATILTMVSSRCSWSPGLMRSGE